MRDYSLASEMTAMSLMHKIIFRHRPRQIQKHTYYWIVFQSQTASASPDLTQVILVPVGATCWMGSLKEPG